MLPSSPSENLLLRLVWRVLPYLLFAALVAFEIVNILTENEGKFIYTLDDPYIHLTLAGQIARGNYGINPGESAAPSSSILWPFLLVPFAWTPFFDLVPIAYNLIIALATIYVYTQIASALISDEPGAPSSPANALKVAFITSLLIPTTNLVGLAFTGMEHSLQVFLCAVIVLGMIQVLRGEATPAWLVAALIAAPWVRYEDLAVTLPALAVLVLCRRWKPALLALGGTAATLGAFSLFLFAHGLGWLPTSVIAKAGFAAYRPNHSILGHIRHNFTMRQARVLVGLMLALILLAVARPHAPRMERAMGLLAAAGGLAHLAAGQFGWMDRYEVYILATTLLWVLYLGRHLLNWLFHHLGVVVPLALLLGGSVLVGKPYYTRLTRIPDASANIYEQQYQMHRFAVDYLKAPVAVNDLGWVAYRNPYYVLDLWGLASPQALQARTRSTPDQVDWMDRMVSQYHVRLVMIYALPGWLPNQPTRWTPVAQLHLGHPLVSAGGDTVTFFVPEPQDVESVRALLRDFALTLPPGVVLTLLP